MSKWTEASRSPSVSKRSCRVVVHTGGVLADGTGVIGSERFFAWDGIVRDGSLWFDQ